MCVQVPEEVRGHGNWILQVVVTWMLVSGTQPVISTRTVCALSAEPSLQLPIELFKSLWGLFSEYVNCKGLLLKKIRMREPREGGEEMTEGKEVCAHEEREVEAKRSKLRPWEDIKQTWSRSMHTPQESQSVGPCIADKLVATSG